MSSHSVSDYIAPSWTEKEDRKLGWLKEASEDGEAYLKSQRGWRDIDRAIDVLSGVGNVRLPKGQSQLHLNMLKRDYREAIATLSNMRPLWGYKTDNDDFQQLATILNKLLMAWYLNTFADRSIRKALQYAGIGGGWISPVWKNDFWITGRGDIKLNVYGPREVRPIQIGRDHDIQLAYAVDMVDEVPFARAYATFPTQTDKFTPDRVTPTWMKSGIRKVQKFLSPALSRFGPGQNKESGETTFPTVDIHTTFILDLSYNDTGRDVWMGEPGTKWYYKVPSYGSDIDTGVKDKATGANTYRKAVLEDCLLFPMRRMSIWTNQGILYDNSSYYWHKKVPAIPFVLDDWPWDFLGRSMVNDGESIQDSANRLARAIDDSANARLDPGLQYDENLMSEALMQRFNPRIGGQRIKTNLQMGDPIKHILPPQFYDVPSWIGDFIEKLWEKMHYILGTRDIQAIAKAKQVPSGDSLEKLMEMAGPIVTDMSRNMEKSMRDLGEMWKGLAMQFYDTKRRVQILGKDGVTEEDYDYDPGNMIPSHLPDELARMKAGELPKEYISRADIQKRAQTHIDSCYFHVTPNSLHQITQLTRKLMNLQLFKAGFPIDPWTLADSFDIDNFGSPHKVAKLLGADVVPSDVIGRWIMFMELKAKLGEAMGGGQKGRKPTGQQGPAIRSKEGGARSTVTESPR
jgi:hypothetical protein